MARQLNQPRGKAARVAQVHASGPNRLRRRTRDNRVCLDITRDDGAGANHRTLSNPDSRQDNRAVTDPRPISYNYIFALVGEVRRLRVMSERENGGFRSDGDVISDSDCMATPVKKAAEIDYIPVTQMNLASIQKAASHLHSGPSAISREVSAKVGSAQSSRGHLGKYAVVSIGKNAPEEIFGVHKSVVYGQYSLAEFCDREMRARDFFLGLRSNP
jgi:hypothetical protein